MQDATLARGGAAGKGHARAMSIARVLSRASSMRDHDTGAVSLHQVATTNHGLGLK